MIAERETEKDREGMRMMEKKNRGIEQVNKRKVKTKV